MKKAPNVVNIDDEKIVKESMSLSPRVSLASAALYRVAQLPNGFGNGGQPWIRPISIDEYLVAPLSTAIPGVLPGSILKSQKKTTTLFFVSKATIPDVL